MTIDKSNTSASLLIVEDEQDLLELLSYNFDREGYQVYTATSGEEAMQMVPKHPPDLILLDLMLPGIDGLEVCRLLKKREITASIPIIMLTARGEEPDIVRGLEIGADDYVPKPFSPRVLLARVQTALRRSERENPALARKNKKSSVIKSAGIVIDQERYETTVNGKPVTLTHTEFKLLALLAGRPGRVYIRQQIIDAVHGTLAAVTDRSVDVQIMALRKKLGEAGSRIQTVRGVGYRFKE